MIKAPRSPRRAAGLPSGTRSAADDLSEVSDQSLVADVPISSFAGHRTAKAAIAILLSKGQGFCDPTRQQRDALRIGYAMRGKVLFGAAFDMVRLSRPIDLTDPQAIASDIDAIEIIEVKSTNRVSMKADLNGYFFNITAAEMLVAQSLGALYHFVFVNTLTREHQELGLNQVFARARGMYPAWHIRF